MKKIVLLSLITSSMLMAGGYKIPETSLNSVALSAANIAHNKSADAAYYNPANMVFMEDTNNLEVDLTYIGLDAINYKGAGYDIDSKSESFIVPSLHYVSGKAGETRIGLSIVSPGGLSKRWDDAPAVYKAKEFTLKVVEINPSVAIPINDKVAIAFGFRMLYSEGIVKSTSPVGSRDMTGDSVDYGYNFALAYKPTSDLEMAFTYRSQVNLTEDGDAQLYSDAGVTKVYDGGATLTVPLPACASLAMAYTLPSKTTVEFVYERNMWSAYKDLDFDYDVAIGGTFDNPIPKDWKDTNTFRLGITQELDSMTLMGGMVYDQTPVPEQTIGFELPDSDSISVSIGGRYQINDKLDIGLSALYSMRESRTVSNDSLNGEFTNANVLIVSTGVGYKF